MGNLSSPGNLMPFFGARPANPALTYRLDGTAPRRPDPALTTDAHGQAEPDRFQHTYADRVFAACHLMTSPGELPHPLGHTAVSVRLDAGYEGPLVATYKVVQDVLDRRARVLARDDNCLRVPELHVSRDLPVIAGNVVTVVDLANGDLYSREFVAKAQPYRVATDGAHTYHFDQDVTRTPDDYFAACVDLGALMKPVAAAHLTVGQIPDPILKDATLTIVIHGLAPKRDLDNAVLAVMDVIQAAREDVGISSTSIDRLVRQVHGYVVAGNPAVEIDIQPAIPTR